MLGAPLLGPGNWPSPVQQTKPWETSTLATTNPQGVVCTQPLSPLPHYFRQIAHSSPARHQCLIPTQLSKEGAGCGYIKIPPSSWGLPHSHFARWCSKLLELMASLPSHWLPSTWVMQILPSPFHQQSLPGSALGRAHSWIHTYYQKKEREN